METADGRHCRRHTIVAPLYMSGSAVKLVQELLDRLVFQCVPHQPVVGLKFASMHAINGALPPEEIKSSVLAMLQEASGCSVKEMKLADFYMQPPVRTVSQE